MATKKKTVKKSTKKVTKVNPSLSIAKAPRTVEMETVESQPLPSSQVYLIPRIPFKNISPAKYQAVMNEACAYVDEFFRSEFYKEELKKFPYKTFAFSKVTPDQLLMGISQAMKFIPAVRMNVAKHRNRNTLAWVGSDSLLLTLNSTNMNRPVDSIGGSVGHEVIHVFDRFTTFDFGHAGNSSKGKQWSTPYWHGTKIKEYIKLRKAGKLPQPAPTFEG